MRVIGYTFCADTYCVDCTRAARDSGALACTGFGYNANVPGEDENGLPYALADNEGNTIHPIFSTDEGRINDAGEELPHMCGGCGEEIG